jgi:membrane associated rhomboid family serine protease
MTPAPVGLRCPDHSGKPQGIRRVTAAAERTATGVGSRRANLVTMILIGLNVSVFALELLIGGSFSGTDNWIFEKGVLVANATYADGSAAGVANGEWWRLVTSTFLHYGAFHLAMNMYVLFFAGTVLEQYFGRWRFLLLYVVSGVAGSAGALYLSPDKLTAGASGAAFGLLGAMFVLERRGIIHTQGQILLLIVLNLAITFAFSRYISVGGHVGGLIAGVVVGLAFLRFRSAPATLAAAAAVAIGAITVAYASI